MSRLIDADALIADLYDENKHNVLMIPFKLCTADRVDLKFLLNEAPTVDAVPVVHGHWEYVDAYLLQIYYRCSECGNVTCDYIINKQTFQRDKLNYCPNCGAKMDGERREENATN